ncbi:cytochrome P450 [Rhizoctonia solani AG-1 IA]|uniref:Cytochrome P450 n=1 Tax=Thanatephorus cucumeris (strain AG1-IA) TaxID=983506 RepID=L8WKZ1_THACA|nr:cytochrome P450 [Rhizoctonia solani AG-1 IA]
MGMFPVDTASSIVNNQLALGSAAAVASGLVWYLLRSDDSQVKRIRPLPFFGQWSFFTRLESKITCNSEQLTIPIIDFIVDGFKKFPQEKLFGFGILGHNVVALRGEEARKAFFSRGDLSFTEGNDQEQMSYFLRHLNPLLKNDRLAKLTPELMSDIERNMESWGDAGKFDPFEVMYSTVFQLTIRTAGAREIADSVEKCKELEKLYWKVEKGSTPMALLLPWLPSKARNEKVNSTGEIYAMFDQIIKDRQREGRREEDALQIFIDQGDSTIDIIGFIMGTLFAGIVNTGLMSAWIYVHLDQVPEWKDKVVEEIRALLRKYAPLEEYSDLSTAERFSKIPPQAWEDDMPVMELRILVRMLFNISYRVVVSVAALRRIKSGDTEIDGKKIPNGTYLVYSTGETHSDPSIYPNPSQYNPGRYAEDQDKAQAYGFLGWGQLLEHLLGGPVRLSCSRCWPSSLRWSSLSQLEQHIVAASQFRVLLYQYTYEVVDSAGKKPDPSVTVPDRNNLYQVSGPFREYDRVYNSSSKIVYPKAPGACRFSLLSTPSCQSAGMSGSGQSLAGQSFRREAP